MPARTGSARRSWSTQGSSPAGRRTTLPAFNAKIVEEFAEGKHQASAEKSEQAIHSK
jgi:hypothetical protein